MSRLLPLIEFSCGVLKLEVRSEAGSLSRAPVVSSDNQVAWFCRTEAFSRTFNPPTTPLGQAVVSEMRPLGFRAIGGAYKNIHSAHTARHWSGTLVVGLSIREPVLLSPGAPFLVEGEK